MTGVLASVDQRTNLVGQNRLELLLFRLLDDQLYGINVFKVREVLYCPPLTELPNASGMVRGVAHIRGKTMSIIDLNHAIGGERMLDTNKCFVVISEYNRSVQGFLVAAVDRIVNLNWENIMPPPKGSGPNHYLTAIAEFENRLIEVIDVEKVLSEVVPGFMDAQMSSITQDKLNDVRGSEKIEKRVLIADDSTVARKQISRCISQMGFTIDAFADGKQALDHIKQLIAAGKKPTDEYHMVISDVEMPTMDGYTLTTQLRSIPEAKDLHIMLHTSLSGVFNEAMVKKVGADAFLAKFNPDDLANQVMRLVYKDDYEPDQNR